MNSRMIFFDVTHTLGQKHVTGVQRVTRCLAADMVSDPRVRLVRFDKKTQKFLVLDPAEVAEVTAPEVLVAETPAVSGSLSAYKRLVLRFRRFAAFRAFASLKDALVIHILHRARRGWTRFWSQRLASPMDGGLYFTTEIVGEVDRSAALRFFRNRRNVELNFVVHDLIPLSHPKFSLVNRGDFRRYVLLLKAAQRLICVSEVTRRQVELRLRTRKTVFRAAVQQPGFQLQQGQILEAPVFPWPEDGLPLVAWVGTIEPRKNQEANLGVLQRLWEAGLRFRFVFVGRKGRQEDTFSKEVGNLTRAGYPIVWLPGAPEELVQKIYQKADFTVYLSLVEGYGLPVLESVAMGTPCITSRNTSMAEIAEQTRGCVLVDPQNQTEVYSAMVELLKDKEQRNKLRNSIDLKQMPRWSEYKKKVCDLLVESADRRKD